MKNQDRTNKSNINRGSIGCFIFSLPFIALLLFILSAWSYILFIEKKHSLITKSAPIDPNDLMNPISTIYATEYQIESKSFKRIQFMNTGGSNQEKNLEIRDSNDYCYFINEYDNYIYPLIIDPKTNRLFMHDNYLDNSQLPQIRYLKVAVKETIFQFTRPQSVEEQRKWLKFRKNTNLRGEKYKNPLIEGDCSFSPRVNIVAIEYSIAGKIYKYQVDQQDNKVLNHKLNYIFK